MNLTPTMNNTKNILLVAIITATLVLGTSVIPMQSYAEEHKKTGDFQNSIKISTEANKKSASQKLDQDNFCYRGDDCEQANQGQQIVGKDNEAAGFNDQSKNLALSPSGAGDGVGTGTGSGTTPTPACIECFTTAISALNSTDLGIIITALTGITTTFGTIDVLCGLPSISARALTSVLISLDIDVTVINTLLNCLRAAGVTVTA